MGAVSGMLGTAGGAGGTGFKNAATANLEKPVSAENVQASQATANQDMQAQQTLLDALQRQNGISNQTSNSMLLGNIAGQLGMQNGIGHQTEAYQNTAGLGAQMQGANAISNQNQAVAQQQQLNANLYGANGVGAQSNALNQQRNLSNQLSGGVNIQNQAVTGLQNVGQQQSKTAQQYQDIANGRGPNPAQAALNQATGQNIANQAALMAGQRGASGNVGLMARQIGQQGAGIQQQAVGQGATMQAQQQINALSGLTAQQQAMAGTQQALGSIGANQTQMQQAGIGQQANIGAALSGAQQAGINAQASQTAQQVAQQQQQQQMLAAQASNQVAQQQAAAQAAANQSNVLAGQVLGQGNTNAQTSLQNVAQQQQAVGNYNNAQVGGQSSVNAANAGLASARMGSQNGMIGGIMNGVGQIAGSFFAEGGQVQKMAEGGMPNMGLTPPPAPAPSQPSQMPQSRFGQALQGGVIPIMESEPMQGGGSSEKMQKEVASGIGNIGKAAMSAPSIPTSVAAPSTAMASNPMGMMAAKGGFAENGGHVKAPSPAQKAAKKGDSYSNDKVPTLLSEGEIVLPRSVTMSKDPVKSSADFVRKVLAKRKAV